MIRVLPLALHMPDGYLNAATPIAGMVWLGTWALALGLIGLCLRRVQATYDDRAVPLMGVCAAFIFAAQMINFPIPMGTSGHLLGGTLAGALLGPWAGSLVMAVVFIVQTLFFQDGGLTVLGANIVNMGLVGTLGGYYLYKGIRCLVGYDRWIGVMVGAAIASWVSVVAASAFCSLQIGLSGTANLGLALGAMVFWHGLIGLGEAAITLLALDYVRRLRPELIHKAPRDRALTARGEIVSGEMR
ncbi:energy-coupling factor ABC transporter permease [Alkalinema sp. FACHB-956]|uniref:energy-coupling factor ABC transporter permease n=1 Tax=Alkalinema sp. FACHB-956 TaxID=2692768 RepID=UPI0016881E10|nr:energy-coupling factor ABC transporter permease [Alkalinema sp. FACHB-956]